MKGLALNSLFALAALMAAVMSGCSHLDDDYSEYRQLPAEGWVYGDTVTFTPRHHNSLCKGRFIIAVRHDTSYPFTELWLELTSTDVDRRQRRDTLHYSFTDRHGNWVGHGIAASFQMTDTAGVVEHPTGIPVTVRHIMRADTLRGVNQVGLFFVPLQ
ncbi:MAG: gliding motility lipoprotein GldH [Muribaculaceae bacterium]|nr:gliding motility lipoprotein GldH [Muribaculaceae bacterium]